MTIQHGIRTTILPTPTVPVRQIDAGLTVCIGAVPSWQIDGSGDANGLLGPFATLAEFKASCGWSDDYDSYPGCEAADVFFNLYNVGPLLIINPLVPATHGDAVTPAAAPMVAGVLTVTDDNILIDTMVVKSSDGNTTYVRDTDYTVAYTADYDGVVITRKGTGIPTATTSIKPEYTVLDPTEVASSDIVDAVAIVDQVFPQKRLLPGQLIAPGWSDTAAVGAAMTAKMNAYNALFGGIALTDVPTGTVTAYANVEAWLSSNSYTDAVQVNCWPLVTLSDITYHLSTHVAALNCQLDADNADIPYNSPSNKALSIDGAVLADGTAVDLGPETYTAAEVPFVTAINFLEWTAWGNRTGAYASSTDPLTFIPNQRMVQYVRNTLTQTFWPAVDRPVNARLVDSLVDTANQWFNSLVARRALLGGRAEFRADLNTAITLSDGVLTIAYYLGFESPARLIEQIIQLDTNYYAALLA